MQAVRREVMIEADGELHLRGLPYRKGDRVEAIVLAAESQPQDDAKRRAARARFLARARASRFKSAGPYPTRDELHERA